jgi:methionyl-tRNA formyltransferase
MGNTRSNFHGDVIFASCKPWHKPLFENLKSKFDLNWMYVSTPSELNGVIDTENPKYIFFLHWNWLVPETIWMQHECVCFHMTDVPYGRGGSPLQNLILAGHKETKLTALQMVREMDAGPVYTKRTLKLDGTAQEIYVRAGALSADIIRWMIENEPAPIEQEGEAVLFKRRNPEQSRLPDTGSLPSTYDFIRMLDADGYPHAFIEHGEFMLKFSKARLDNGRLIAEVEINKRS